MRSYHTVLTSPKAEGIAAELKALGQKRAARSTFYVGFSTNRHVHSSNGLLVDETGTNKIGGLSLSFSHSTIHEGKTDLNGLARLVNSGAVSRIYKGGKPGAPFSVTPE